MKSKARRPACGLAVSVLLLAGAPLAHAQTANAPGNKGALQFSNVRVLTASPEMKAQAERSDGAMRGMRAYIDPETNELRDQRPEEMHMGPEAMGKAARAKGALPKGLVSPSGGKVMEVDESLMSYSVVSRDAAGRARMQCVTGEQAAFAALLKPAREDRHGH
jgi:hypothetical protein